MYQETLHSNVRDEIPMDLLFEIQCSHLGIKEVLKALAVVISVHLQVTLRA